MKPSLFVLLRSLAVVLVLFPLTTRAAEKLPTVRLQPVADGFVSPLNTLTLDDGSGRLLIADQLGTISIVNKDGTLARDAFFDLRPKLVKLTPAFDERGLLGLALHPRFRENRLLYIYYSAPRRDTAPTNWNHTSHLSEFKVTADFARVDPASERLLLAFDKPQANHNCGRLTFGPDGFLYVGVGDGGGANDNEVGHPDPGNGQNTKTFLGKILRLDVDGARPYGIPKDNPFADGREGLPEIYAYGLRNPWGLSFDRGGTRQFLVADVGQNLFEEVNIVVKGGNYGWRVRESFHGFHPTNANKVFADAPTTDTKGQRFQDPILEYPHPPRNKPVPTNDPCGISVTGGYVYRGKAIPGLQGKYIFGDWSRTWALADGVLFAATPGGANGRWSLDFLPVSKGGDAPSKLGAYIVAFGEDAEGELYLMTSSRNGLTGTGQVFKLVPM